MFKSDARKYYTYTAAGQLLKLVMNPIAPVADCLDFPPISRHCFPETSLPVCMWRWLASPSHHQLLRVYFTPPPHAGVGFLRQYRHMFTIYYSTLYLERASVYALDRVCFTSLARVGSFGILNALDNPYHNVKKEPYISPTNTHPPSRRCLPFPEPRTPILPYHSRLADAQKSDILNTMTADVDRLSVELRTVNNKLDDIMSLLLGMTRGQGVFRQGGEPTARNLVFHPHNNSNHAGDGGGGVVFNSGGSGGGGGTQGPFVPAVAQAAIARGSAGDNGYGQWVFGAGVPSGGIGQAGQEPSLYGAPGGNYVPQQHQQQQQQQQPQQQPRWQGHPIYSQQYQQPASTEQYQVAPNQVSKSMQGQRLFGTKSCV